MRVRRFPENPIIRPDMSPRLGENVNGPSLIRVPDWIVDPLGRYYLYFGHHLGDHIRLAYADDLHGPWHIYEPGVLSLSESGFTGKIASPDVHINDEYRQLRLYFHGRDNLDRPTLQQGLVDLYRNGPLYSRVAVSTDGLDFQARSHNLGRPYMRLFRWGAWYYALAMPGVMYRSRDGLTGFEDGPNLFNSAMRHSALKLDGDRLSVFFSNAGDCPEQILRSRIRLTPDWLTWQASDPELVLAPELDYEGGQLALEPSRRGNVMVPARQLRDPATFQEDGHTYLLYAVAGEHGIAIAELLDD
jgi:hypothetical protein